MIDWDKMSCIIDVFLIPSSQHAERREASRQITTAVLQQLISYCTDCNDIIDMQSLNCGSESVIIYRARLEGTSQTDSGSLISVIETWVTSEPSFIVIELLMTVDSQCTVVISSLSDHGDCTQSITDTTTSSTTPDTNTTPSSSSDSTSSDTAAIIGGGVAVVIVIVISIVIGVVTVAIVALVIKSHQTNGDVVIKKQ